MLLSIPPEGFKLIVDNIIWAVKHSVRDLGDTGLHSEYSADRIHSVD